MNNSNAHAPKVADRDIAKALISTQGNISAAARLLSQLTAPVTRAYVKRRIDSSPALQALLEDIRETILDDAEANLYREVMSGKVEESRFVLTTLGRSRGYVKTTVIENTDAAVLAKRIQDARRAIQEEQETKAAVATSEGKSLAATDSPIGASLFH